MIYTTKPLLTLNQTSTHLFTSISLNQPNSHPANFLPTFTSAPTIHPFISNILYYYFHLLRPFCIAIFNKPINTQTIIKNCIQGWEKSNFQNSAVAFKPSLALVNNSFSSRSASISSPTFSSTLLPVSTRSTTSCGLVKGWFNFSSCSFCSLHFSCHCICISTISSFSFLSSSVINTNSNSLSMNFTNSIVAS